jgi:hypoxanthine phosphoribosyltransferase
MTRIHYSNHHITNWLHAIVRDLTIDRWTPDLVVGLTRGGLVPAVMLSHYFNVPMSPLHVSLRDAQVVESAVPLVEQARLCRNILIVDDINDSGNTLGQLRSLWKEEFADGADLWVNQVRIAVLVNNVRSSFQDIDYCGTEIDKLETPVWCVYPWENWWDMTN